MEAGCNIVRDNFTGSSLSERLKDETPIIEGTTSWILQTGIKYTLQNVYTADAHFFRLNHSSVTAVTNLVWFTSICHALR